MQMTRMASVVLAVMLAAVLKTGVVTATSEPEAAVELVEVKSNAAIAATAAAAVEAAIDSPDRPAADRERDASARPGEVLLFLGVTPGMRVADMFSAGGYYTELLARTVGVKGQVIAWNNPPYAKFAEKGIAERYAGGRLGNVRQLTAEVDALELPPASLDAALFVMSYHDAYWRPADKSWDHTDPVELLRRLFLALKPGAVVVVQDHVAAAGGDVAKVVDTLHRIDPALVRRDFERAGFVFDGSSAALAHPDDDHTRLVFEESIRGRTDQFVYRFRKPVS
jgi:predicted methyltransferase